MTTRPWTWALLGVGLLVALAGTSYRNQSATFDEGVYIAAGYAQLATGDQRLVPVHPPLAKLLAGSLPYLSGARADFHDGSWNDADPWSFAHRFVYEWNDASRILGQARLPAIGLTCVLALAVFFWTHRHWGSAAATLALLLTVLSPDVLAHGQLATTDMAVTTFFFLTVVAFERLTRGVNGPRLLMAGLALGGAISSKFSALVLIPILVLLAIVLALGPWPVEVVSGSWPGVLRGPAGRAGRVRLLAALLAAILLVALGVVWAAYGFRFSASAEAGRAKVLRWRTVENEAGWMPASVRLAKDVHVVPEAYAFGLLDTFRRSHGRPAFLAGHRSDRGWWYFFPVAFALKEPLALFVLLALAAALSWGRRLAPRLEWFLWLPAGVYFCLCLASHVDIGLRFLLPVFPFLFVAAGRCAALAAGLPLRIAVGALAAAYASAAVRVHPHYLAYFNELAGGPASGYRWLVDSNLDWGQDLPGLAAWLRGHGHDRIKLSYFGTADPRYYGIAYDLLPGSMRPDPGPPCLDVQPGDLVAVSATNLQALYLPGAVEPLMERLRASRPIAAIGYSIFLYRADFTWLIAPEDAGELDWLEPAAESYAAAIRRDPGLADAHGYLGVALHLQGRHRRAADAFDEAQRLDPDWLGRHRRYEHAFDAAHRKARQAGEPEREDVVSSPARRPAPAPLPEG